nr:MAG TPA: cytochrome c protein [Caudoviricetes sp.]
MLVPVGPIRIILQIVKFKNQEQNEYRTNVAGCHRK